MKNNVIKVLVGAITFFLVYAGISYLIDKKVDIVMTISMTIGYAIGYALVTSYYNRKKNK